MIKNDEDANKVLKKKYDLENRILEPITDEQSRKIVSRIIRLNHEYWDFYGAKDFVNK